MKINLNLISFKISLNSKDPIRGLFLAHLPNFLEQKKFFPITPARSCTTSYGSLSPCQNAGKSNDLIPRKNPDRRQDGRTDTLFHRILLATAGGLASKTAVDGHLKVKDIEYEVGLTKNYRF